LFEDCNWVFEAHIRQSEVRVRRSEVCNRESEACIRHMEDRNRETEDRIRHTEARIRAFFFLRKPCFTGRSIKTVSRSKIYAL
jgi:hypothetical protein